MLSTTGRYMLAPSFWETVVYGEQSYGQVTALMGGKCSRSLCKVHGSNEGWPRLAGLPKEMTLHSPNTHISSICSRTGTSPPSAVPGLSRQVRSLLYCRKALKEMVEIYVLNNGKKDIPAQRKWQRPLLTVWKRWGGLGADKWPKPLPQQTMHSEEGGKCQEEQVPCHPVDHHPGWGRKAAKLSKLGNRWPNEIYIFLKRSFLQLSGD